MCEIDETLADPFVGTLFAGRYRIEAVIGRGGMGSVYKAHHEVLARDVAIKVLHPRLLARDKAAQMFRREARAVSRVDHPNVTAIYDFGHDEAGHPYIAMEYVVGRSLASQLVRGERDAPISLMRAIGILAQIAEALAAAHAVGVVHRDLKPENVLLTSNRGVDDFVKVLDFGLARLVDGSESASLSDGDFFGTPEYMSPEQCGSGHEVGPATDLYSFGVIAYELTTGRPPFDAQGMQLLFHHQHNAPPPPAAARGSASPIDPLIERCLAKDPAARGTADQLVAALRDMAELVQAKLSRIPSVRRKVTGELPTVQVSDSAPLLQAFEEQQRKAFDRRARERALDELVIALCERGLDSSDLVRSFAIKLEAEDEVLRIEAKLDLMDMVGEHHERRLREREARLRPALGPLQTAPGRAAALAPDTERVAARLRALGAERDELLATFSEQTRAHRGELAEARAKAREARDELVSRLRAARDAKAAELDIEMQALFAHAAL